MSFVKKKENLIQMLIAYCKSFFCFPELLSVTVFAINYSYCKSLSSLCFQDLDWMKISDTSHYGSSRDSLYQSV